MKPEQEISFKLNAPAEMVECWKNGYRDITQLAKWFAERLEEHKV